MEHMDNSFLSELYLINMQYSMDKYMDYAKKTMLTCEQFYILEQEQKLKETQVMALSPTNNNKRKQTHLSIPL